MSSYSEDYIIFCACRGFIVVVVVNPLPIPLPTASFS